MGTEKTYIEGRIKKILYEMSSQFYDIQFRQEYGSEVDENREYEYVEDSFTDNAKRVYKLVCFYIEKYSGIEYLKLFKENCKEYFESNRNLLSGSLHYENGEIYSNVLSEIWQHLFAFEGFGNNDYELLLKRTGISFLENILENTSVILSEVDKQPTSETEVYNAVKVVTKGVFPSANFPTTSFITMAQEYKPDILLPFLNCAIEYKYAMTEQKLKSTIDQIFADVKGYSNHNTYKIFYAVFYVRSGIWGQKKFNEVWKEKGFPDNWKGILVEAI